LRAREYDYYLPPGRVALTPAARRDDARLLVYDPSRDEVFFDVFRNLGKYVPPRALLVLNDTKVVPARLTLHKPTGGRVHALLLLNELQPGSTALKALLDRHVPKGALLRAGKSGGFRVVGNKGSVFDLRPDFPIARLRQLLEIAGAAPLPPYLRHSPLTERERRQRYQSIFAKKAASVAAPTASLHFTNRLLSRLGASGVRKAYLTLHVGQGTFAPPTADNFQKKKLHTEYYFVPSRTRTLLRHAKRDRRAVVAVGTTVARALESSARNRGPGLKKTSLFILPPHKFSSFDALLTNFHLPRSSLLCLLDAFLRSKKSRKSWRDLYRLAIREKFRFYSFGDAMLIL